MPILRSSGYDDRKNWKVKHRQGPQPIPPSPQFANQICDPYAMNGRVGIGPSRHASMPSPRSVNLKSRRRYSSGAPTHLAATCGVAAS